MNPELLSRLQFALTASFHYIYPPISIGLGMLLVVIGIIYVRTKNPLWRQMSFFWVKVFGLVFAIGVASGIVMEFEFGTNWSDYSRYVGNVFGSLLAAEGVFAFALEGGFLGLMLFGGNRLGPRMWLLATFLVAFGAHFSAVWIVMANSWMQTPAGFAVLEGASGAQAFMTSFWQVMFTPSFLSRISHVLVSAWMVGAALMLSVSAWYLLKKRHVELAKANFTVVLPIFIVLSILQVFVFGSDSAVNVHENQPVKLAAMEGLWQTQPCAPIYVLGWVDESNQRTAGLSIPCMLSLLSTYNINSTIEGLESFPPELLPPINLVFQSYHFMVGLGFLFIPIGLLGGLFYLWKRRVFTARWVLWLFVPLAVLTLAATIAGWWVADIGRQPWIVYEQLLTADGVSPNLTTGQVLISLVGFIIIYAILFALFLFLLNQKIQHGPDPIEDETQVTSLPDTFREVFNRKAHA